MPLPPDGIDEPVVLVHPDPSWPSLFAVESDRVRHALRDLMTRIEHVGSTAVPGLPGKPIVDLLVGVRDLADGYAAVDR